MVPNGISNSEDLLAAYALEPLKINLITGSDSWPNRQHRFGRSGSQRGDLSGDGGTPAANSSTWQMPLWLEHHPRLTADLSHWCVAERLTPDLMPVQ